MKRHILTLFCGLSFTAAAMVGVGPFHVAAQEQPPIEKVEFGTLTHRPLPAFPGVGNVFLIGAFDQPGLYAAQGEMKQGATFPPHSHPDTRLSIVTSGTMYLGFGETYDAAKLVAYPVGTMAITPAGTPHFMAAPVGDVTVLEIGSGPSGAQFFGQ